MNRIGLVKKISICVVITLFINLHCDVKRHLPVQDWCIYCFLSVQSFIYQLLESNEAIDAP